MPPLRTAIAGCRRDCVLSVPIQNPFFVFRFSCGPSYSYDVYIYIYQVERERERNNNKTSWSKKRRDGSRGSSFFLLHSFRFFFFFFFCVLLLERKEEEENPTSPLDSSACLSLFFFFLLLCYFDLFVVCVRACMQPTARAWFIRIFFFSSSFHTGAAARRHRVRINTPRLKQSQTAHDYSSCISFVFFSLSLSKGEEEEKTAPRRGNWITFTVEKKNRSGIRK